MYVPLSIQKLPTLGQARVIFSILPPRSGSPQGRPVVNVCNRAKKNENNPTRKKIVYNTKAWKIVKITSIISCS